MYGTSVRYIDNTVWTKSSDLIIYEMKMRIATSRGVTRHLFHETRWDKTVFTRTRFIYFFKSTMIKYIGENSILFKWKTQNAKKVHFEINLYFMKLNLFLMNYMQ